MNLLQLLERFNFYTQNHKQLLHNPAIADQKAFVQFDWEDLATAVETAVKFPCLFLQTPEIEKEGNQDNVTETYELTFLVLDYLQDGNFAEKPNILQKCKSIVDDVYNRMQLDAGEIFDSEISKTQEGSIKSSGLIGWQITLAFTQAYDASVNAAKWEDLA